MSGPPPSPESGSALRIPIRSRGSRPGHTDRHQPPADVLTRRVLVRPTSANGMTIAQLAQLAQQTGVSYNTLRRFLRQPGIPLRPGRFPLRCHIDRRELVGLRRQGLTVAEIAVTVGLFQEYRRPGAATVLGIGRSSRTNILLELVTLHPGEPRRLWIPSWSLSPTRRAERLCCRAIPWISAPSPVTPPTKSGSA